jgi:hypothetical protein
VRLRAVFLVEDGCMRGSRKDGRRSAIASVGLYIAVIVGTVNVVACERWSSRGGGAREVNARSMQMRAKAEAAGRWVAADVVVNFGRPTHCRSTFQASPTQSSTSHAPFSSLFAERASNGKMASNKKSGLTGYLPDILMAAAAVRSRLLHASVLP